MALPLLPLSLAKRFVALGWSLYFLVASLSPQLPWLNCNNTWNTALCRGDDDPADNSSWANLTERTSAASEYFK